VRSHGARGVCELSEPLSERAQASAVRLFDGERGALDSPDVRARELRSAVIR
jgi:hypothetical protein